MKYADFIAELERLISTGRAILDAGVTHEDGAFRRWRHEAESIVEVGRSRGFDIPGEFNSSRRQYLALWMGASTHDDVKALRADLNDSLLELEFIVEQYRKYGASSIAVTGDQVTALDPAVSLERICNRIPLVIRQLRDRHDGRSTLKVDDDYDLQDILHGLLHLFFDDVRPEEHTPSYAGKATRMDFLLKNESIVIEAKNDTSRTWRERGRRPTHHRYCALQVAPGLQEFVLPCL
jgi:hypothetical protein